MSEQGTLYRTFDRRDLDAPRLYDGVRTRRAMSFFVDYAMVLVLCIPVAVLIFFLGIVTLSIGWHLYAIMLPAVALVYVAFTMGGRSQATPGMRLAGVHLERLDGGTVDPATAALHGVLFWASVTLLTPFVLLVALFTRRKQLLHDIALGTVIVRDR
ncbi:RDD family protein [Aureimonas leprariae]|uniref:RDD family protein n=1 Tax=Plantimonas leprariae TaxID=2615207 RepID=A0A7V7TX47_9HYPH|nr:RDD family protein [Aureimonas leprariae]KAB0680703.1 RDD family protein [Aureimonas leprariae]